jgi:hypothetical protein
MEQLLLLQGVREASSLADPSAPRAVSQRSFDEARARSSFPDLPAARNIARQLGLPWAKVLSVAHEPRAAIPQRLGRKQGSAEHGFINDERVIFALRAVALRLGRDTLSLSQYRAEREQMLAIDRARFIHGGQLILPNEEQVMTHTGSWPEALRLAGLQEADRIEGRRAPSLVDLMERFYERYSTRPTLSALEAFASGNGIPFPDRRTQSFSKALAAWRAKRSAGGLPEPAESPPTRERPDYSSDVGAALPGERRQHKRRSAEECVAWMRRHMEGLPAGSRSTQHSYRDWARVREGAPSPSAFARHGGLSHVRSLAQEQMRAEASG